MHDQVERIESVKAGGLSALAAGISYCLMMTVDPFVLGGYSRFSFPSLLDAMRTGGFANIEAMPTIVSLGLELAISIISGFLFGVTYRYIIRTDRNDHLNAGAVLAFGLVRGLAQLDVDEFELSQIWMDGLIVGKSILLFSIARYTLDYALAVGWILPFAQQSQDLSLNRIKTSEYLPEHTAETTKLRFPEEAMPKRIR
jgi:hypothetical protein